MLRTTCPILARKSKRSQGPSDVFELLERNMTQSSVLNAARTYAATEVPRFERNFERNNERNSATGKRASAEARSQQIPRLGASRMLAQTLPTLIAMIIKQSSTITTETRLATKAVLGCILLSASFTTGCGSVDEPENVGTAESAIWLGSGDDVSNPTQNAVVRLVIGGTGVCTGTLVAPNLVLTAGHCVDMMRVEVAGASKNVWGEWETPGAWYPFNGSIVAHFGLTTSSTVTYNATEYSLPSGNDAFLLKLAANVPASVAIPSKVMTRLPAASNPEAFFSGEPLKMVGFGGTGDLISLGGNLSKKPNCVSTKPDRINCFARNNTGTLIQTRYNGAAFQSWATTAAQLEGVPSCVSWGTDRIDCFYRRSDGHLGHLWSTNDGVTISAPEDLNGNITSDPECVSWGSGRLDCFARDTNNQLKHIWYQNGWGSFATLGSWTFSGQPSCTSWGPNRLDCFVRNAVNGVNHIYWNGSTWSAWEVMAATTISSDPKCVSHSANNIDCVARGSNNSLQHLRYAGSWQPWANRGGLFGGTPNCTSWGPNRLDCVGFQNGQLYHAPVINGTFGAWKYIGHGVLSDASCVSWDVARLDCFALGQDNTMRQQWWDGDGWSGGKLATTRQLGDAAFSSMTNECNGDCDSPSKFLVSGASGDTLRGGDSGGPIFLTDTSGVRWIVGVTQGFKGDDRSLYTATFSTGGVDSAGRLVGSMRTWLEGKLSASQTGTPQ